MKTTRLTILSLCFMLSIFSISGFSQGSDYNKINHPNLPDIAEVVKEFYGNYSIRSLPSNSEIKFEKKRTGWHIAQRDAVGNEMEIVSSDLFWSVKKGKYLQLKFDKLVNGARDSSIASRFPLPFKKKYFRISPYYGYPGWDLDVIKDYGKMDNLPDSILYALGRAYSSFASNLLNNNTGYADKSEQFNLPDGKNSMTEKQLETYRHYIGKAIEEFEKLTKRDSLYECIVGPIKYKLANEYLTSFLFIGVYQNREEAFKELKAGIYDRGVISIAKNYLNSCAKDAILFTNGDNDTFPLLYVQTFLGFRKDVLVVNLSLLNTHRYINSLRDPAQDAIPLDLSFEKEAYKGHLRDYLPVYLNREIGTMDLGEALDYVQSDLQSSKIKTAGRKYLNYLPTKEYRFKVNKENALLNGSVSAEREDEIPDYIEWAFKGSSILRSKMIVMDIIHENDWKRPIYYCITVGSDAYDWIGHHLQLEGLAYRIVPLRMKTQGGQTGQPSTGIMYENIMNKFEWEGIENNIFMQRMAYNFKNIFSRLADALIKEGKKDSAIAVLDRCVAVIPNDLIPYSFFMIPILEGYYRVDLANKANSIVRILVDRYHRELIDIFDGKGGDLTEAQRYISTIQRIKQLVTAYKQPEYTEELTTLFDDLEEKYLRWKH